MANYADYQNNPSSEKIGLCILHASKRLKGWVLDSGSIYKISYVEVIEDVQESGASLTRVSSLPSMVANSFFHDRANGILYVWTSGSQNPNSVFLAVEIKLFFANVTIEAPHDLSTGFDVLWRPLLRPLSNFGVNLDNQNQFGQAIEGSGSVSFENDRSFWDSRFDKLFFENHKCFIYSWNRELDPTEARIIYRGKVQGKTYSGDQVSFQLKDFINELRAPVPLTKVGDIPGVSIQPGDENVYARRLYGEVFGVRPFNIDQNVDGKFDLTGVVSVSNGSTTLIGVGTSFLGELSPEDNLLISGDEEEVTVQSIQSDTSLTLSDPYEFQPKSGASVKVNPDAPKRFTNRTFLVASHALAKASTTIVNAIAFTVLQVADASKFRSGDAIKVNSFSTFIDHVSGNLIFLTLGVTASNGDTVELIPIRNVMLDDKLLAETRDYTIDSSGPSKITLTNLAEFNVSRNRIVTGSSIVFTASSRAISGTGTFFTSQLKPGDWIRASGQAEFFEILQIIDDTNLELRTASTYSSSTTAQYRAPEVYAEGTNVISLDARGVSDDETETGMLLSDGPSIIEDLLKQVGIGISDLDVASFTLAKDLASQRLGIAIPETYNSTRAPKVRDIIDNINKSIFGSLIQNADFLLKYNILRPVKTSSLEIGDSDVLSFNLSHKSDKLVKSVDIQYRKKEYDFQTKNSSLSSATSISNDAQYLAKSEKTFTQEVYIIDDLDAQQLADRYSFLFSLGSSVISVELKLQGARKEVGDPIVLNLSKLFERLGSNDKRKVVSVQGAFKSATGSKLDLEDLANAFTRCAVYTDAGHANFIDSDDTEKALAGYWTDEFGLINNDGETFNLNLYW